MYVRELQASSEGNGMTTKGDEIREEKGEQEDREAEEDDEYEERKIVDTACEKVCEKSAPNRKRKREKPVYKSYDCGEIIWKIGAASLPEVDEETLRVPPGGKALLMSVRDKVLT